MTQRTIHRAGTKSNGHGEREKFEKWLLTPAWGRRPRDGSEEQQRTIQGNLGRVNEARFNTDAKALVLGDLCRSVDPDKAFRALKALTSIASGEMLSQRTKQVLMDVAQQWCTYENHKCMVAKFGQDRYARGRDMLMRTASFQAGLMCCSIEEYLGIAPKKPLEPDPLFSSNQVHTRHNRKPADFEHERRFDTIPL